LALNIVFERQVLKLIWDFMLSESRKHVGSERFFAHGTQFKVQVDELASGYETTDELLCSRS